MCFSVGIRYGDMPPESRRAWPCSRTREGQGIGEIKTRRSTWSLSLACTIKAILGMVDYVREPGDARFSRLSFRTSPSLPSSLSVAVPPLSLPLPPK